MDILFDLIIWIIKSISKSRQPSSRVGRSPTTPMMPRNTRQAQPALTASEQKTKDIWGAYRKKQEMLEAQFRAKAPK